MPNGSSQRDGHKTTAARDIAAHRDVRATARWTVHAWQLTARADLLAGVVGVIGVAVHVDRDPGGPGDVDGLGGSLLGA